MLNNRQVAGLKPSDMMYIAIFQRGNVDQKYTKVFDCPNLEDATTEAVTWAEDKGDELLQINES